MTIEYSETGLKKGRGRAQRSLDLIRLCCLSRVVHRFDHLAVSMLTFGRPCHSRANRNIRPSHHSHMYHEG
jgi:hypothetical protein